MPSLLQRACAWAALATFSAGIGLGTMTAGHAEPDDDAACRRPALIGGRSPVQFEAAEPSSVPAHCVFCHWQRVVSGARPGAHAAGAVRLEPMARVLHGGTHPVRPSSLDVHLSRGPPADL